MKVVCAVDSLKGSLTSLQAGHAIRDGILRVYQDAQVVVHPIADGGEGTVDALVDGLGGVRRAVTVTGPLGEKITAEYGIIPGNTAVIEISAAAGITLVPSEKRNPMHTTTYGVGELILDAAKAGCRNFIIGIGGSATNDGGVGMLQALGFGFLDENGAQIAFGAQGLENLCEIADVGAHPKLSECTFHVACDVINPLCGKQGCSAIYGPQKGADDKMIFQMDGWLSHYATLAEARNPHADRNTPGAGAAGGLGFAFLSFLRGKLQNGIELILTETDLESDIRDADVVVTGEGRLDAQTVMGKAPIGVAKIAQKYDIPTIAFSGAAIEEARVCNDHGIDAYFPILRTVCTLDEALNAKNAYRNMADTAEQAFRLMRRVIR
ncbi:MAG: glycerate kinase [Ruminococcaceae bacterium]|nr:glycerate kinase [Oscillospiraceae bacterium]